ncbi:MAG: DNA repair protein RecO [Bacteroidia bacterium]|nr:DNA repair protein RecO [Bacteroidia bacterium]
MILKTEGIVLRTLRYQENSLITTLYTRDFGVRSFLISGFRSARSRAKHSYFQPLSIIDIVFFHRENRDLHKITESKINLLLLEAQTDPVKLSLGLAIIEIFYDTVKEEEQNEELYEFLRQVILLLDRSEKRLIQIFIFFLLHLTKYLGFFPSDESEGAEKVKFMAREGIFLPEPQSGEEVAHHLLLFANATLEPLPDPYSCQQITFPAQTKKNIIKTLFEYYHLHVEGFKYPQTMKVFAELFGD